MNIEEYEKLNPRGSIRIDGKVITYCIPNRIAKWRLETLLTKEPDTIAWIRDEFNDGDVFMDVGANVGMYSILAAALHPGVVVHAFEPEARNFALLCDNIAANRLDNVTPWCLALSSAPGMARLALAPDMRAGRSGHQIDTASVGRANHQGVCCETLDRMVWEQNAVSPPTHIKIDVDGLEPAIIDGAMDTLAQLNVKSVLVEIDRRIPAHSTIAETFDVLGYVTDKDQMMRALRTSGPCAGVGNVIFRRKGA